MIENILYEIDNAFNESENNVLEAIQESCYKALEILENTDDDRDVECFGVFQEAVATTATMEKPKTKTDKPTKKDENTDTKNKKEDQKIEKVVTIDPRVAAAAEKFKADKKKKTEENLSKLATVNARKIDKLMAAVKSLTNFFGSKAFTSACNAVDNAPKIVKMFIDEFKKVINENSGKVKHIQESVKPKKEKEDNTKFLNMEHDQKLSNIMLEITEQALSLKPRVSILHIRYIVNSIVEKYFTNKKTNDIDVDGLKTLVTDLEQELIKTEKATERCVDEKFKKKLDNNLKSLTEMAATLKRKISKIEGTHEVDSKIKEGIYDIGYQSKYVVNKSGSLAGTKALDDFLNLRITSGLGNSIKSISLGIINYLGAFLKDLSSIIWHKDKKNEVNKGIDNKDIDEISNGVKRIVPTFQVLIKPITIGGSVFLMTFVPVIGPIINGMVGGSIGLSAISGVVSGTVSLSSLLTTTAIGGTVVSKTLKSIVSCVISFVPSLTKQPLEKYMEEVRQDIINIKGSSGNTNDEAKGEVNNVL